MTWSIASGLCVGDTNGLHYVKSDIVKYRAVWEFPRGVSDLRLVIVAKRFAGPGRRSRAMFSRKRPNNPSSFIVVGISSVADDVLWPPRLDRSKQPFYALIGWPKFQVCLKLLLGLLQQSGFCVQNSTGRVRCSSPDPAL
jgi:hypothetical protein